MDTTENILNSLFLSPYSHHDDDYHPGGKDDGSTTAAALVDGNSLFGTSGDIDFRRWFTGGSMDDFDGVLVVAVDERFGSHCSPEEKCVVFSWFAGKQRGWRGGNHGLENTLRAANHFSRKVLPRLDLFCVWVITTPVVGGNPSALLQEPLYGHSSSCRTQWK